MTPIVRKVAPVCRCCGGSTDLIRGDGPIVCRPCVWQAGILGQATVRRSDTPRFGDPAHELNNRLRPWTGH